LLAYPTSGSLSLQAEDRLRLFRFPLTRDTLPLSASAPIRVNSTGGILTLWLIRLRGTPPASPVRAYPWVKGGGEKRIYEISKRLVERGHEVHWFGNRQSGIGV